MRYSAMEQTCPDWDKYARLQAALDSKSGIDSHAWGLEAAMNGLLDKQLSTSDQAELAISSAARKERNRARLRRLYIGSPPPVDIGPQIEARDELRIAREHLEPREWALLIAVAQGQAYDELAVVYGVGVGALRVRVLRIRRLLTQARLGRDLRFAA
jgi:hypothetical protein